MYDVEQSAGILRQGLRQKRRESRPPKQGIARIVDKAMVTFGALIFLAFVAVTSPLWLPVVCLVKFLQASEKALEEIKAERG